MYPRPHQNGSRPHHPMGGQRLPGADGIRRVQCRRDGVDFDLDLHARRVQ